MSLKPGMTGTATITTTTTTTPVTVTEIENGTVAHVAGSTIIVRTDEVPLVHAGRDRQARSQDLPLRQARGDLNFRAGDGLSATIVTTMPPTVVTEQEVQATVAAAAPAAPAPSAPAVAASAAPGAALPVGTRNN